MLMDVWAFECWNCYRLFPWLNALEGRLSGERFKVVWIHSPELDAERDPAAVAVKVREFGLRNPIMLDTDHRYRDALGNQYWPAWYLVDRQGHIRALRWRDPRRGCPGTTHRNGPSRLLAQTGKP